MEKAYLLGIDIGTSSIKTLLTDFKGRRLAQHTFLYDTIQEKPGYVEQLPEETWWAGAKAGIEKCLADSAIDPRAIAGICASGMVPNLCPLDENGRVVRPAILYRDNRAIDQANRLKEKFGWNFSLQDVVPKLLWIKENEPENYGRIAMVLNSHSYIAYKLTGNYSSDHDIASIFGEVYDGEKHEWMPERMDAMGLDRRVLPPLYWPIDTVGTVNAEAARITGLAEGTPVICGTGDSYTVLVGSGAVNANDGLIYLGTAGTFLGLRKDLDDVRDECPFLTGNNMFLGNILTGGEITHWFRDSMMKLGSVSYQQLEEAAAAVSPGADGLMALPHLLGERTPKHNPLSKGVIFGLTNAHSTGHVYRAFLEGVAFALRDSYEHNDLALKRLILVGGGANCALWRQIIADVLGMDLEFIPGADNALGTAYLGGIALGIFDSFSTIRDEWLKEKVVIRHDPAATQKYEEIFRFYRELSAIMQPAYIGLAKLSGTI